MSDSFTTFKIHPAIGCARLGNTDDDFYLAPEQPGELPIACDDQGREQTNKDGSLTRVSSFKDDSDLSLVKKQAARFKIFAYKGKEDQDGEEIKIGGEYDFVFQDPTPVEAPSMVKGTVTDITWTVHLANKKASWYEFQQTQGSHGYGPDHPLRNADVDLPDQRRQLIIDPGPVTVNQASSPGYCSKFGTEPLIPGQKKQIVKISYPQTFPPEDILPNPITTLGTVIVNEQDSHNRLIVLGGNGNSGSTKTPVITNYVNNDGWFDDISDGPVTASISYTFKQRVYDGKKYKYVNKTASVDVQVPAWVVVGYPRYVPQMLDMITMDECMYDVFVRNFAYDPEVYGIAPYDKASNNPQTDEEMAAWRSQANYNPEYYPKFYKEIWPMLRRPDDFKYTYDFDLFSGGDPHNRGTGGNLDETALSQVPEGCEDPNYRLRQFILTIMRRVDQANDYLVSKEDWPTAARPRLMPMLCGSNPIDNNAPQKFLSMTETQLFFLQQWAKGKFVNECTEWGEGDGNCKTPWANPPTTGVGIDRGVLSNLLGGAFMPGGELTWIITNPAIYSQSYRIKHAPYQAGALSIPAPIASKDGSPAPDIKAGLEPGDLTKYIGIPWQSDFHECVYQNIDVTYKDWCDIYLDSTGDPAEQKIAFNIPWWPAHRPIVINDPTYGTVYWASGLPFNNAGDLQMVQAWKDMGFLIKVDGDGGSYSFEQQERNNTILGDPIAPGDRTLGQFVGKSSKDNNQNS